ncbi:hypothetical protein LB565_16955 [Mesorhizobium sp. CA14]|uniref:dTMP kinase n=1 Tax=Mesorhizobium sp. CA14 TaxID=2876642 RepID=UPI001CCB860A|nr:hypothetical protein [Mesorhizobium sp. CA14]MBZ9849676.1 hypothetical protein [Mesorhizobium sp. CA14]
MPQIDVMQSGVFVTIEGIDGSGKSMLADEVAQLGVVAGRPVHLVRKSSQIGDGYVARHAEGLREILWREHSEQQRSSISDTHWLWLAASWFALVEQVEIRPRLQEGFIVVSDSWFDKILARFSLKPSPIAGHATAISAMLRRPDFTVLLDVPPEMAADRKREFGYSECGNFDGFDGRCRENFVRYQGLVRWEYLRLARAGGWTTLEGTVTAADFALHLERLLNWR